MFKWNINPSVAAALHYFQKIFKLDIDSKTFAKVAKENVEFQNEDIELQKILTNNSELAIAGMKLKTKLDFIIEVSDYPYQVLGDAALRTYGYIKHRKLEFNTDKFVMKYEDIASLFKHKTNSKAYKIVQELVESKIIYRSDIDNIYFINLCIVYKGSMIKIILNILKRAGLISNDITSLTIEYVRELEKLVKQRINETTR